MKAIVIKKYKNKSISLKVGDIIDMHHVEAKQAIKKKLVKPYNK